MNKEEIKQIKKYFHKYRKDEDGKHYMHNVEDYFHIVITPEDEVYQLNEDGEIQGVELQTIKSLKVRLESFVGEPFECEVPKISYQQKREIVNAAIKYNKSCYLSFKYTNNPGYHFRDGIEWAIKNLI